jgi:flagellar biosynthesis protein FlhG
MLTQQPVDQADALREMAATARAAHPRARIVAVTSGKGGVGKSNISVNLAVQLAQMGRRIILLDADLGTANVDVLCNLPAGRNLAHVVAGRQTLDEAMIVGPGGFRLIPGASGLARMAALAPSQRDRLIEQLRDLEHDADMILIDTGAGVSPNVLGFSVCADQVLVVTTPEPTAVTDAYAVIKSLHRQRQDIDVRLLVNMVQDQKEGRDVFNRLDQVCRRFLHLNIRYAGHVAQDVRVGQAVRRQKPFVIDAPGCGASACINQLAHRMDRHAATTNGKSKSVWRRLSMWLAG